MGKRNRNHQRVLNLRKFANESRAAWMKRIKPKRAKKNEAAKA